jgi:2-dehydro-3-deoxygluconokinase
MSRVVCFGEILLRLSAPGAEHLLQTPRLNVVVAGAEANVAVSLSRLGDQARMVSVLPENPLGRAAAEELRRYGVDVGGVRFAPGRMGLYFLTPAAGLRAAEIFYDRAESAFVGADLMAIDWSAELAGAAWLHLSGITAALGEAAAAAAVHAAREAKRMGLAVSLDSNHRAKIWAQRGGDGPGDLRRLMESCDLLFADQRDLAFALGRPLDGADGRAAADAAFAAFPNLERLAHTVRVQTSAEHHDLSAAMFTRGADWRAPGMALAGIVDRIGAGDAFAAGLIHALRAGRGDEAALRFALAAAALKHFTPGDFNLAREADVEAVMDGASLSIRR